MNLKAAGRWRIKNDDLPSQQLADCLKQSLPDELGQGHSAMFQLDTDLNYIETHYQPSQDLAVLTRMDQPEPRLVVTLGMKGQSRFVDKQGHEIIFNEGYTSITAFHASVGERQYQAQNDMAQVRFSLGKTWLDRYFGEKNSARFFNKNSIRLLSHRPISNTALIATRQLLACDVDASVKRLFMHGQAMSILATELSHLWRDNQENASIFHQKDQDIAHAARSILINEFKNPPSVSALSKRVGTNQFKLKQLFHHYFNTTPYGLLLAIRMDNAYRLLETSSCQIDVAADYVGYNHASNFSAAFSKYFGISPSSIAKRHKS
ncbi:AraC family transcriptional regulator [Methylomonas montana]|uniref:helix-turn-helix transcriptional regulator n=1 Tax=Methylomonas montana TaxID=3058963 RepID=UPI002657EB3A|nr:AraC family transcriptional regulator [Methylomonas montana]WKJ90807.1 AraC family transcriptional regulator [Methylomonas montana]